jgi:hypothetical protein
MNCLYEAVAEFYLRLRGNFVPVADDDLADAEDSLEACRANLSAKERELSRHCVELGRAALAKRRSGDLAGARFHLLERRRNLQRLDKLRTGLSIVDKQLDTLRTSELDKELVRSLRESTVAMKRAGLGVGLEEAETVMTQLDEQMREASELTSVLAAPIQPDDNEAFLDLDAELESLTAAEAEAPPLAPPLAPPPAPALPAEREPLLRQPAAPAAAAG